MPNQPNQDDAVRDGDVVTDSIQSLCETIHSAHEMGHRLQDRIDYLEEVLRDLREAFPSSAAGAERRVVASRAAAQRKSIKVQP